jgi:hypothetical protein
MRCVSTASTPVKPAEPVGPDVQKHDGRALGNLKRSVHRAIKRKQVAELVSGSRTPLRQLQTGPLRPDDPDYVIEVYDELRSRLPNLLG